MARMARQSREEATLNVSVVGQGYVGLPLALAAADSGYRVTGIDSDEEKIESLNAGLSPVGDVEPSLISRLVASEQYSASNDFGSIANSQIVVLCVPTPYHNQAPDLSYIESAASAVGRHLRRGALVILESTTYPGTTEEVLGPILESASGLAVSVDFDLAFSPERIDPGNGHFGIHNTPKIVGGLSARATDRAADFYSRFVTKVVRVSSAGTAEMAKLLENTFRHINIALVNELAIACREMHIDVWEVIDAAASKPFGFMPFYPGPGVGGHCIPVDPMYLSWRVRQFGGSAKFIELARDVNNAMPLYVVERIQDILNDRSMALRGSNIVVLGVSYKAGVADVREAPAVPLLSALLSKGASVTFVDPYIPTLSVPDGRGTRDLKAQSLEVSLAKPPDCVVIVTPHPDFDLEALAETGISIFDTRNSIRNRHPNVERL